MKQITTKKSDKFVKEFTKLILEIGAKVIDVNPNYPYHEFELDTQVGLLTISLPKEQSICYTVFSRFKEAGRASKEFACNPHSGKYNSFISNDLMPEKAAEVSVVTFKLTLPK